MIAAIPNIIGWLCISFAKVSFCRSHTINWRFDCVAWL